MQCLRGHHIEVKRDLTGNPPPNVDGHRWRAAREKVSAELYGVEGFLRDWRSRTILILSVIYSSTALTGHPRRINDRIEESPDWFSIPTVFRILIHVTETSIWLKQRLADLESKGKAMMCLVGRLTDLLSSTFMGDLSRIQSSIVK